MDAKMTAEPQSTFYTLSWEGLHFEWQGGENVITLPSHNIEPCQLQHVLSAEGAKRLFMANLAEWIELRVESPGRVSIVDYGSHVKDSEQPWPIVIPQIEHALQNTTSISLPFDSLSELEETFRIMSDRHKQVMSSKDVGVYIENQTDKTMLVKFVGAEQTVKLLIENVKQAHETSVQRKTQMMSLSNTPQNIKTYFRAKRYSVEIVEYIEATHFKKKLYEHYPDLKLTENKDDHSVFEICGPREEGIRHGFLYIDRYVHDLKQLELKLEVDVVSFVQNENVSVFLKLRLKEVSAYFIIGKCVTVWAADDMTLIKAEECFHNNIRCFNVEGWWSPDATKIIESNHNKIVCTFFDDTKKRILFTNDRLNDAEQLAKVISESVHVDKTYTQWQWKVRAFVEFGVLSKLQSLLQDIDIQVLEKQSIVRLQARSKSFLGIASKEVDEYMSCIRKLEASPADENGIKDLITRKGVQENLKAEHKIEGKIIVVADGNGSSCFVYLARTSMDPPLKDIFVSTQVDNKKLKGNAGKRFLEKHKDMIYMKENPKTVYLCTTKNICSEFVTSKPETRKKLNHAAFRFLRKFGSDFLKTFESKYSLLTLEDGCVVCLGDETVAQQCLDELEKKIAVSVIHLTDEENGREIDLSKAIIDEIANKHAVGIDTFVAWESCIASNEAKGKQFFAKWCFGNDNGRVAVADVDFTISDTFIDVVVIPVNSCLYGRDIFHDRKADVSYGKHFDKPSEKQQVGFFKRWACEKGLASKHCVALVTDDVIMTKTVTEKSQGRMSIGKDQLMKSFSDIFREIFDSGLSKICVAVSQDNSVITRGVETIVQTFQERLGKCKKQIKDVELVFCLRRNPEEIIQNVDRSVKYMAMTRRELSPLVQGIFVQPEVKTTVLQESLEKVAADCYALAVSPDVNLGKGPVAIAVSAAAGPDLQKSINTKLQSHLKDGDTVVFEPFELKRQGVRKLIFGNLPIWKDRHNLTVIERFVEDCLLRADSLGCSSVAFPALGTGNLKCPPRDVAGAMLDGIAKYAAETTTDGDVTRATSYGGYIFHSLFAFIDFVKMLKISMSIIFT